MSNFKVIQIINHSIIQVSPSWIITREGMDDVVDDKVTLLGITSQDDVSANIIKERLSILLLDKEVTIVNPTILHYDETSITLGAKVLIDDTDVAYYFPEYKDSSNLLVHG